MTKKTKNEDTKIFNDPGNCYINLMRKLQNISYMVYFSKYSAILIYY